MRHVTSWFILTAPFLILAVDWWVYRNFGTKHTITGVVRGWSEDSWVPEVMFLLGCLLLWLHLFRNWPGGAEVGDGR